MNYFETDITNPLFGYYAMECDEAFSRKVNNILDRCGARLSASQLTEELKREGLDPMSLSQNELNIIDESFDCC